MANGVDPDQTAPIGAVCSGSTLFASILNLSVMLGNYLQQTTSADDIFRCIFLGALRVKENNYAHRQYSIMPVKFLAYSYLVRPEYSNQGRWPETEETGQNCLHGIIWWWYTVDRSCLWTNLGDLKNIILGMTNSYFLW